MQLVLGLNILINNSSPTLHRRPNSKKSLILEEKLEHKPLRHITEMYEKHTALPKSEQF